MEEWEKESLKAFTDIFEYLKNPEYEIVTIPEVIMKDGTIHPAREVKVLKKPDFV